MRKSLIMGTKEDVSRMRSRNLPSKRNKSASSKGNDTVAYIGAPGQLSPVTNMKIKDDIIVTFNHPCIK